MSIGPMPGYVVSPIYREWEEEYIMAEELVKAVENQDVQSVVSILQSDHSKRANLPNQRQFTKELLKVIAVKDVALLISKYAERKPVVRIDFCHPKMEATTLLELIFEISYFSEDGENEYTPTMKRITQYLLSQKEIKVGCYLITCALQEKFRNYSMINEEIFPYLRERREMRSRKND